MSFTDTVKCPIVATDAFVRCRLGNDIYVLVIERKYEPYGYALPGGKLDCGETLYEGVIRELREETGLEIDDEWDNNNMVPELSLSNPDRDPRTHVISFVFGFEKWIDSLDELPVVQAMDDAKSVRWMHINEVRANKEKFVCDHYDVTNMLVPDGECSEDYPQDYPPGMFWFF